MLVEYVKNKHGVRVGVVVATGPANIGWSSYNEHKEEKRFDKKLALEIAKGRAEVQNDRVEPATKVQKAIFKMRDRARRYYQGDTP